MGNRYGFIKIVSFFVFCFLFSSIYASSLEFTINTPISDLSFSTKDDSFDIIKIKDCSFNMDNTEMGRPFLPVKGIFFIIPPDMKVDSVLIISDSEYVLPDSYLIYPTPRDLTPDSEEFVTPDSIIYNSNELFPNLSSYAVNTGCFAGYKVVTLKIRPLQYMPLSRQAILRTKLTITLLLSLDESEIIPIARRSFETQDFYEKILQTRVSNPEDIQQYRPYVEKLGSPKTLGDFKPTSFPSVEGSPVDYLIITTDDLESGFKELAKKKIKEGIPAVVKTISWITANYPGCDIQEKIRNFIRDAKSKWDITWVLLGGNVNKVPSRRLCKEHYGHDYITTDSYYAELDGSWNTNRNSLFGEYLEGSNPEINRPEWDVFVGRIPAETNDEVLHFIDKLDDYESPNTSSPYQKRVLLYSHENSGFSQDACSKVANWFNLNFPTYAKANFYTPAYTKDELINGTSSIFGLNGYNSGNVPPPQFVYGSGHGVEPGMAHYTLGGALGKTDFDFPSLNSPGRYWIYYPMGCQIMPLLYEDCLCRHVIKNENGGAIAVISYSTTIPATPSAGANSWADIIHIPFFERLLGKCTGYMGKCFEIGIADLESRIANPNNTLEMIFTTNLLGDPSMKAWSEDVTTNRQITYTIEVNGVSGDPIEVGTQDITIIVNDLSSNPISGARVCLWKEGEVYVKGITGSDGKVFFYDFTPKTSGTGTLCIVAQDYLPIKDETFNVSSIATSFVSYKSHTIQDGNTGGEDGNGDLIANPGEKVNLTVTVQNTGIGAANNVTCNFSTTDPYITPSSFTFTFTSIPEDEEDNATVLLTLSPDKLTGNVTRDVSFDMDIISSDYSGKDNFKLSILADRLEHTRHRIYWDVSEYKIDSVEITNWGEGAARDVTLEISQNSNVWDIPCGDIEGKEVVTLNGAYSLNGIDIYTSVEVAVKDYYSGRSWSALGILEADQVSFSPPDNIWAGNLGQDFIELNWNNPYPLDFWGRYNVYKEKTAGAGDYERQNKFIIDVNCNYKDEQLTPWTEYKYAVETIDIVGNRSGINTSYTSAITTNPPLLSGEWPIEGGPDIWHTTPKVGDLDGDGTKEIIIVWNNTVRLWKEDGSEITSGWPKTLPYSNLVTSSSIPAIADVNGDGKDDIILVAGWNGQTNVWDFNGDDISGWPQYMVSGNRISEKVGATVSDLDGDGNIEIITNFGTDCVVWNTIGEKKLTIKTIEHFYDHDWFTTTPVVGDINDDGKLEFILASGHIVANGTLGALYVADYNGIVYNTPELNECISGTAIGDVDGDGKLELVTRSAKQIDKESYFTYVTVWKWTSGSLIEKWKTAHTLSKTGEALVSGIALANLDNDDNGELEIIVAGPNYGQYWGRLWVYNYDLSSVILNTTQSGDLLIPSPVVGDIDKDGYQDLLEGGNQHSRQIFGFTWDKNNNVFDDTTKGFPLLIGGPTYSSPIITDLNADNTFELVCPSRDMKMYAWNIPVNGIGSRLDWPERHHDRWNTGNYHMEIPEKVWLNTEKATIYNNQHKLAIDENNNLHLVYETGNGPYYAFSSDKGKTWSQQFPLGSGKNATIALSSSEDIHVCWVDNGELKYRKKDASGWTDDIVTVSLTDGSSFSYIAPPSMAIYCPDQPQIAVCYYKNSISKAKIKHCSIDASSYPTIIVTESQLFEWNETSIPTDDVVFPSIALRKNNPHICWEKDGKIYYRGYVNGEWDPDPSEDPFEVDASGTSCHPCINAQAGYVRVVYEKDNDIWCRTRDLYYEDAHWYASLNKSNNSTTLSNSPQVYGPTIVWAEEGSGGKYDIWASDPGWVLSVPLSDLDDIDSKYPQEVVSFEETIVEGVYQSIVRCVYTKGNTTPYQIKVGSEMTNTYYLKQHITDSYEIPEDGVIFIEEDVTIDPGVTLTIKPGAKVYFSQFDDEHSGADTMRCELIVKGTLIASSATFNTEQNYGTTKAWYGIKVENGGNVQLKGCEVKGAVYGIYTDGSVLATNNLITNDSVGIYVNSNANLVNLGNLRNDNRGDDGMNSIYDNIWNLYNVSGNDTIMAQANYWDDTLKISAKTLYNPPGYDMHGDDWIISSNTTIYGTYWNIGTFKINPGITAKVATRAVNTTGWISIIADSIDVSGIFSADSAGYGPEEGPGAGVRGASSKGASGAGFGGRGGSGGNSVEGDTTQYGGYAYGDIYEPCEMGSGGGYSDYTLTGKGGTGGGVIRLSSLGTASVSGTLCSNGKPGTGDGYNKSGGGGSGGSIWLQANKLIGTGTISCKGGDGANSSNLTDGGAGAGGRIHINYENSGFSGRLDASGGAGPDNAIDGQPGTILVQCQDSTIALLSSGTTTNSDSKYGFIKGVELDNWVHLTAGDSIVGNIELAGDSIIINSGSYIIADSKGYAHGQGEGAGHAGSSSHGGGAASHYTCGGYGSYYTPGGTGDCGTTYDDTLEPQIAGSGGGDYADVSGYRWGGGPGGGIIKLDCRSNNTGRILINGSISANGTAGTSKTSYAGGGGSGGSILIYANTLEGTGTIQAKGGNGGAISNCYGGGGAGGLITLYSNNDNFTGYALVDYGVKGGGTATDGNMGIVYRDSIPEGGGGSQSREMSKPLVFKLHQNYPNPFVTRTTLMYQVPTTSKVSLKLYNVTGRCVKTLVESEKVPGYYKVNLEAKDYPAGVYFAKFDAGKYKETKKLVLMK